MLASLREFPVYSLKVTELEVISNGGKDPVQVNLSVECGLQVETSALSKAKKQKNRGMNMTAVLTVTSDMDFLDFRRIPWAFHMLKAAHQSN